MEPLERLFEPQTVQARQQPVLGLVTARVLGVRDDGTCLLDYLSMGSGEESAPARVMMPMAGSRRGMHFFPEKGDEVVVAFEGGDPNQPVVLGAVWNDNDRPPDQAKQSPDNHVRTIVSRSGHELTFDDTPGAEKVTLRSKGGHELTLDDRPGLGRVTLRTAGGAALLLTDTPGSAALRTPGGAQLQISDGGGAITVSAPVRLEIRSGVISLQANTIELTTTGSAPLSAVVIDGKPFGLHLHAAPPPAPPTAPATGTVTP
jgi:hypothetical protein